MPFRRRLVAAIASAVLFAVLTTLVALRARPVMTFDARISSFALLFATEHHGWRTFVAAVTRTGGPAVVTVAAVIGVVILMVIRRWRVAGFVATAMLGSATIRLLVVNAVARPRPAGRLAPASGFSFPSGHTTGSAAAALTALVVCWPLLRGRSRVITSVVLLAWAVAVGLSRVALVVHWPTDVLGGWLLVAAVVSAASLVLRQPGVALEPGGGQLDELGGSDRSGDTENGGQQQHAGETATAWLRRGPGQGTDPPHDDATVDTE